MKSRLPWVVLLACAASACSPVYVGKAAAGHARLLWNSRDMASALRDPATPAPLKEKLKLALEVREFAFDRMGLKATKDYSTFSPVSGAVTYVVSACPKTKLEPYQWWFPFVGKVPYKGYFARSDADELMRQMRSRGFDARVGGVAAYKTPLWFTDPLPSSALDDPPGELAELIIHELAHGTVWIKDRVDFDEAAASFLGEAGAADFLARRFGPGSAQLREYRESLARGRASAKVFDEIYARLDALYRSGVPEPEKLSRREEVFAWGRGRLESIGQPLGEPLDNAVVLAYRLYQYDLDAFAALHERCGRDWMKTVAALRTVDPREPFASMARKP